MVNSVECESLCVIAAAILEYAAYATLPEKQQQNEEVNMVAWIVEQCFAGTFGTSSK
jgi:hypothetical protein